MLDLNKAYSMIVRVEKQKQVTSHISAGNEITIMHVLRYLKGTPNKGLFYPATNNFTVTASCDADEGTCPMSARFLTGYCLFMGSTLLS